MCLDLQRERALQQRMLWWLCTMSCAVHLFRGTCLTEPEATLFLGTAFYAVLRDIVHRIVFNLS